MVKSRSEGLHRQLASKGFICLVSPSSLFLFSAFYHVSISSKSIESTDEQIKTLIITVVAHLEDSSGDDLADIVLAARKP